MRRGWFGARPREAAAEACVALGLLALIAEERLDGLGWDRLARALLDTPALAGIDWDWVTAEAQSLRNEAPLFSEARPRIAQALSGSALGPVALELATSLLHGGAHEDAFSMLGEVAERIGQPLPELADLPRAGLLRCAFDEPSSAVDVPFHVALGAAGATERSLLLFKLRATRAALSSLGGDVRLKALGHKHPMGASLLCADAELEGLGSYFICRFLARHEAMHPAEHGLWAERVAQLGLGAKLLVGHEGPASPADEAFLSSLDPGLLVRIQVSERRLPFEGQV